jgi:hypothetical protein
MDAAVIAKAVGDTYKPFADGDVAVGIGSVLELTLKALFGSVAANSTRQRNSAYLLWQNCCYL